MKKVFDAKTSSIVFCILHVTRHSKNVLELKLVILKNDVLCLLQWLMHFMIFTIALSFAEMFECTKAWMRNKSSNVEWLLTQNYQKAYDNNN